MSSAAYSFKIIATGTSSALGCFINRTFFFHLQRVLRPTFLTCLVARSDYKGICRCCALYALSSLGLLMLARPSGFQRPYSFERGAQRTLDCYRGVFSIAAAYVVPIVSSWGLRSHPWHEGCEFTSAQIRFTLPPTTLPVCRVLFCDDC